MRRTFVLVAASVAASIVASITTFGCGKKSQPIVIDAQVIDSRTIDAPALPDAVTATCTPTKGTNLTTVTIATGLNSPIWVTSPPGDKRLFVIEQPGRIRIIENNTLRTAPFLDLSADATPAGPVNNAGNEEGLLGLAFHPDYAHNGRFYVHYTQADGSIIIAEYRVSADPYTADPKSARVLLTILHPTAAPEGTNHNSGTVQFGPDGYLYDTVGDGGGGGDPNNNAQTTSRLTGKMTRIDVDGHTGTKPYGIPADNPFASSADGANDPRPEIWSYGWRNAYRWDFDSATGDQIVADVGQDTVEEVDVIPHGTAGGANYGWHVWEGNQCYPPGTATCSSTGMTMPNVTHTHADGWCAVIGGVVYRGSCFPDLVGTYFYTDYCKQQLWAFTPTNAAATDHATTATMFPATPTAIHTDALGEMYVTSRDGTVRHIIAGP